MKAKPAAGSASCRELADGARELLAFEVALHPKPHPALEGAHLAA
jgi:hypothetical protein